MLKYCLGIMSKLGQEIGNNSLYSKLLKASLAAWLFFAGIHFYLYCVLGLVVIDVITGIMASLKKGEEFKSRLLRRGLIEKLILYLLLIISIFILEIVIKTAINYTPFYLVIFSVIIIATYEISSILENL